MRRLPEGLHGAHLRAELAAQIGASAVRAAIDSGRLRAVSRRVLVDPRRETELRTRAAVAQLLASPDGVLTGHTALALHGYSAAATSAVQLLVPYGRKPRTRPGITVHHGSWDRTDVVIVDRLRVIAADVAAAEVMCTGTRRDGIACADQHLATIPANQRDGYKTWLEQRIWSRADERGRNQGLQLLTLATGLAESPPESWLLLTICDAKLPLPEQQVSIRNLAGAEVYRLDFGWSQMRVAVEYDGYAAHEGRQQLDAAREEDLRRRGWIVIRADAADLRDPSRLIAAIRAAFRVRGLAA